MYVIGDGWKGNVSDSLDYDCRYARRLGAPGPTGVAIFGVGAAICAYGFYRVCVDLFQRFSLIRMSCRESRRK